MCTYHGTSSLTWSIMFSQTLTNQPTNQLLVYIALCIGRFLCNGHPHWLLGMTQKVFKLQPVIHSLYPTGGTVTCSGSYCPLLEYNAFTRCPPSVILCCALHLIIVQFLLIAKALHNSVY